MVKSTGILLCMTNRLILHLLTFYLSLYHAGNLSAQDSPPDISGSWIYTGTEFKGEFTIPVYCWDIFTFYTDGNYQMKQIIPFTKDSALLRMDTLFVETGKWKSSPKTLRLYQKKIINETDGYYLYKEHNSIYTVSDSELVFIFVYDRDTSFVHYKRIPLQPRMHKSDYPREEYGYNISTGSYFQPGTKYYLVNTADNSRRIEINNSRANHFILKDTLTGDDRSSEYHDIHGFIQTINDTSISIQVMSDYYYAKRYNYYDSYDVSSYFHVSDTFGLIQPFSLNSIEYITYNTELREALGMGFGYVCLGSVLTALIAAPLVNIDYKGDAFNKTQFWKMELISAACFGVSFPLGLIFSDDREIFIGSKQKPLKSKWYFEEQD